MTVCGVQHRPIQWLHEGPVASYSMGVWGSLPRGGMTGSKADHTPYVLPTLHIVLWGAEGKLCLLTPTVIGKRDATDLWAGRTGVRFSARERGFSLYKT